MSPLSDKTFVFELGRDIRFKAKQELINYLREQNAHISYILTASTDYILVSNDIDTYKTRRAKQLGIPLVDVEYIYECRNLSIGKEPIDIKRFIVTSAEDKENFSKSGTIPVSGGGSSSVNTLKPIKIDLSKIKIWNCDDVELPRFDEITHAEIGKWAIFKETNDNSDVYFALELQIIPEEYNNQTNNDYRIRFRYEKQTITSSKGKISLIQYAFSNDINELQQLFASYYHRIANMPRITRIRDLLPDKLGSKLLLRSLFLHRIDTQMLDDNVCQLIESLWIESIGDLNQILSVQPESIALKTIIEAEAALLEIKSNSESSSQAAAHFYSLIPHQQLFVVDLIKDRRALIDKIDLCQMLRDLLTVNELTNWNVKASIEAKYRALKCHIETIKNDTQEYTNISNMIHSSTNSNEQVIIHHVYSVVKQTDALNFRSTLFNQRKLFHGSKYNNFLGILTRGLLMPKMVVNDLGITRTDIGCLGYGIYFSDSISTSLKYTNSSTTRPGRRLLCISQVALGDSANFYSYTSNLIQPPQNFHSTHGVKKNNENNSKFIDDEYVIYNLDQQRLLYIIEVSWKPYDSIDKSLALLPITRDHLINRSITSTNEVDIPSTIEDEVIQVAEQDYGLICPSSGQPVPLKAFHIRAQLVDITAEVVLYQVYHNTSLTPIEAKYVFPLDENCSVCGFEAHINNKIIKGVVKEKEQAKREYREAIEKGHGAYLMHQEQAEVFSVSVGNLPANCEVIIKITYVAELPIENNDIIFRLPAKVASWQSKQALEMKDQTILPSINLEQDNSSMKSVEFSLKASIRMPYEIHKLFSPTHRLRRKITDCLAMIELVDNILLEKDFILSITLKSINLPRMLNETYVLSDENNNNQVIDENSQACMLTFYPKFEMINNSNEYVEIVFIIDVSNSMDGNHIQQAKQLAHLFLTNMKNDEGNIYFNIVTFGSDNDECFPISSLNTKENIDKAKHFVLHSLDHRGNTDLFSVLRQYSLLPSPSKLGRQFILLSDGHINDLKPILTLLENQSSMIHDRLFTCSIGDTSNKHNLKQLANGAHGGGLTTVFDSNYRSRWKTKVLHLLEHIRQPCVNNISIDWHGNVDNQQEKFTNQAPKIIRSLFNGMRLTVYRFIQNCHKATLTAMINNQEFVTTVFSNKITETKGRILHCLTARAIIHDYENGMLHIDESENELIKKQYKQDLIELSMKYSVVSSFTSFVAIEERDGQALEPGVRLVDVMLEHDIDLLPYIGWDGDRSQIDMIKEKLLNAKRLFDSASISNKLDLTNEYEDLCQNISYRSGGAAKYDLMLTIIDTYRMTLKENEKAQMLEEKMQEDLINEINNATADERNRLEKQLDEINKRIDSEKLQNLSEQSTTTEGSESNESIDDDDDDASGDDWCSDQGTPQKCDLLDPIEMYVPEMNIADEEESNDFHMGSGYFADERSMPFSASTSEKGKSRTEIKEKDSKTTSKSERVEYEDDEEEEEEEGMGFGLFDNDDYGSALQIMDDRQEKKASNESKQHAKKMAAPSKREAYSSVRAELVRETSRVNSKSSYKNKSFDIALLEDTLKLSLSSLRRAPKEEEANLLSMVHKFSSGFAASIPQRASASNLIQQQQQEQQQQSQQQAKRPSSYVPSEISDLLDITQEYPLLADKTDAPEIRRTSLTTTARIPSPLYPSQSSIASNSNADDIFQGFGAEVMSNAAAAVGASAAVAPHPLNSPRASFSFQPFLNNNNNSTSPVWGDLMSAAPISHVTPPPPLYSPIAPAKSYSSSTSQSFYCPTAPPPPPPPPPPPQQPHVGSFSFGAPGSSASHTNSLFGSSAFGGLTLNPSTGRPPPPPPQQLHVGSFSFGAPGSSASPTNSLFGSTPFGGTTSNFSIQAAASNNFLFGSSGNDGGKTTNIFSTPSPLEQQNISMPSTLPPTVAPSPQAGTERMFNSSSLFNQPQSFPSGQSSTNTSTTTMDSRSVNPSLYAVFDPYASSMTQKLTPSTRDEPLPSVDFSIAPITTETESTHSFSIETPRKVQSFQAASRSKQSAGRGGRDRDVDSGRVLMDTYTKVSEIIKNEADGLSSQYSMLGLSQFTRYMDTRMDECERQPVSMTSSRCVEPNDKSKKKKVRVKDYTSAYASSQDLLLLDVTPLGLGIEDSNGQMCTIISRNRTIPTKTEFYSVFTNAYAHQTAATIRVFQGEHKLTKYNTFIGEFILTGLTPNFASQVLQISISMDVDANDIIHVYAEESRSGAKAMITIDPTHRPISHTDLERHIAFVDSNPDYQAIPVANRNANDSLSMLKGDTEYAKVNFTGEVGDSKGFPIFDEYGNITLTSTTINELKRIQLTDGSFDLNEDFANLLSMNMKNIDELKKYLYKQGFNSLALNIQNDIIHLIATGIILLEFFFQIPISERKDLLVPFDSERIRSIFHIHLPKVLLPSVDQAIHFYEQKRLRYGIYCEQLELNYSSWEKFIQYAIRNIKN